MSKAIVSRIHSVTPHPNADRLELLTLVVIPRRFETYAAITSGPGKDGKVIMSPSLVTGKHYRAGDLGVWLLPDAKIPGWLAHNLWLVGKEKASDQEYTFTVKAMPIRGVESRGLWVGEYYQTDTSAESHDHYKELKEHGGSEILRDGHSWIKPDYWNDAWRVGDTVDKELGIE